MNKDKIGVFGGTFNPIHIGHLILAQNALDFCDLSKIIFIPSGYSYFKDQRLILPKSRRIDMVSLAIEDNPNFELSTIECDKEGNSYTCETLRDLSGLYNNADFYYIIGDDTLFSIDTWKNPEEIFDLSSIIVAKRDYKDTTLINDRIKYLNNKYNANIILLDSPNIEISSSEIRQKLRSNHSVKYYLHEKVNKYIIDNGLYI